MNHNSISIRPFLGAKNFETSLNFYREIGFEESRISPNLIYFQNNKIGFYLQDAYVEDWVNNTMVFMEVAELDALYSSLEGRKLGEKFEGVRLLPIKSLAWGREFFLHDPSGILWHFGEFTSA
jgi:hypothetical protein